MERIYTDNYFCDIMYFCCELTVVSYGLKSVQVDMINMERK